MSAAKGSSWADGILPAEPGRMKVDSDFSILAGVGYADSDKGRAVVSNRESILRFDVPYPESDCERTPSRSSRELSKGIHHLNQSMTRALCSVMTTSSESGQVLVVVAIPIRIGEAAVPVGIAMVTRKRHRAVGVLGVYRQKLSKLQSELHGQGSVTVVGLPE